MPPRHREIHARRAPHRHRRRQSLRARAAHSADSPFLRRPDLLRSMLGYWLNHPSLSYLFSGMFIGPTSQAPRIDETRNDSLYELEIAFSQIPIAPVEAYCPPWLVDRIFRHCWSTSPATRIAPSSASTSSIRPTRATGRLGLLEMRGFEMPPHARMSLTQQLLVRALVAWFWREPLSARADRLGHAACTTASCCRISSQRIFSEVLDDLQRAGYPFEPEWFAPHFEFRYPGLWAASTTTGIEIELRQAIEPWYVLGEEPARGGTARFVDSSVERLQVKVDGLTGERYAITCNGRRVPLQLDRHAWRIRRGRPLSRLAAAVLPASDDSGPHAAGVRRRRHLGRTLDRRMHLSRGASGRPQLRDVSGQRQRGRGAPEARFFAFGHTPGPMAVPRGRESGVSRNAGLANQS